MQSATILTCERSQPEEWVLGALALASAELLASRALLQRVDTKFVLERRALSTVLAALSRSCALLSPEHARWAVYYSTYFDTPELTLFHDHRRGRRRRFKVRVRHYLDRQRSYLEIKKKDRPGATEKLRREIAYGTTELSLDDWRFVDEAIAPLDMPLAPVLSVGYRRITLVATEHVERVTFDLGLTVRRGEQRCSFDDVVIAEVKQPRLDDRSPVMAALRAHGLRPTRASKYCLGVMALEPAVRANRFLPIFRTLKGGSHG